MTKKVLEVRTHLTAKEIEKRVFDVARYERFSVFTFELKSEQHAAEVLAADSAIVKSPEGEYIGYVEDCDDGHYYVNLR